MGFNSVDSSNILMSYKNGYTDDWPRDDEAVCRVAVEAVCRVAVIDGHPLFRDAVVRTLETEGGFEIVGEGENLADALDAFARVKPDVVVADLSWPAGDTAALEALVRAVTPARVLVFSTDDDRRKIAEAFQCGVSGYLLKKVGAGELVEGVKVVAEGRLCVSGELMTHVLAWISDREGISEPVEEGVCFTEREEQVLRLLASGKSNKNIAYSLGICEKTVKHYVTHILRKIKVANRVEAALFAHQRTRSAA